MKKRPLVLAVLVLVLVSLVGILFLLTGNKSEDKPAADSVPTVSASEISAIEWTNSGEEVRLEKRDGKWYWAGDEIFPVDQLKAEELAQVFTSLESNASIPDINDSNLKDYGLHFPIRTLAAEGGGKRIVYEIGNQSPLNSSYFYVRVNSGGAYLVNRDIYDDFELGLYDVIQTEKVPVFTNISSVTFETADSKSVYTRTEDSDGWIKSVNGDDSFEVDTTETNLLVKKITGLKWEYCAHYSPSDEEKAEYGIDSVSCTVTVIDKNGEFILELGANAGDYTYAKLKGSDMVYLIDGVTADAFIAASK